MQEPVTLNDVVILQAPITTKKVVLRLNVNNLFNPVNRNVDRIH
jgi:hypothetical protein